MAREGRGGYGGGDMHAEEGRPVAPEGTLNVGVVAPDFTLPATGGRNVSLGEFRGKRHVALFVYVLDWTGN